MNDAENTVGSSNTSSPPKTSNAQNTSSSQLAVRTTPAGVESFLAELQAVDAHLLRLSRWVIAGMVIAYLLFAALCITAAYLWVDLTTGQQKSQLKAVERKLRVTDNELARLRKKTKKTSADAHTRSERIAKYFQLYLSGDFEKIFNEHQKLANQAATPLEKLVTRHVQSEAKRHASFHAYCQGVAAYNQGKTKKAVDHLESALKYDRTGPHVPALHYYLGLSYYKLSQYRKATVHLEKMIKAKSKHDVVDEHALFRLGHAHEMLKQTAMAKRHYQRLLKKFPKSQYTSIVKSKLRQL